MSKDASERTEGVTMKVTAKTPPIKVIKIDVSKGPISREDFLKALRAADTER